MSPHLLRARGVSKALAATLNLGFGLANPDPGGRLNFFAGLQRLVYLEEMLDLKLIKLGDVGDVAQVSHPRVSSRHAEHLVVIALLIAHPEHADRPAPNLAARERRLLQQHQRVKGISVISQRVFDKSVIGWIAC